MNDIIYTHDEAAMIVGIFEDVLNRYGICVPSPEDDEGDPEDMVGLYGSTYSDLLDYVEGNLIDMLEAYECGAEVVTYEFSGTI